MDRRQFLGTAVAAAGTGLAGLAPAPAAAAERRLTIASSHPTTLPWVGLMQSHFQPEVNRLLKEAGSADAIRWREAYGGQLYKHNATLTSVEQGVTDVGWVFTQLEASKMPLFNVTTVAPFTTDRLPVILDVMNELTETIPAMQAEWRKNNAVFLGSTGVDTYHLFTRTPVTGYGDLQGKKLGAPGAIGLWLRNSGAVPVDGNLQTYYTDIQTGVIDGCVSIATGILPSKIYEVAPYITKVDIGALCVGAIAANRDTWEGLPEGVRTAMRAAGRSYTAAEGAEVMRRAETAIPAMVEAGKTQSTPVTVGALPAAERTKWIGTMPNIAEDWVAANEARGLPARQVLAAYLDGLRKRGVTPARDWTKA